MYLATVHLATVSGVWQRIQVFGVFREKPAGPACALVYDNCVNLLAHAFLARGDADRIVGQLCGDFVRGSDLSAYPEAIQAGIRCHRAIDTYTDHHELNLQARNLFSAPYRRFAGIVVDVIYDYFLANEWDNYCDIPLHNYTDMVARALSQHRSVLPTGLRNFSELHASEGTLHRNLDRDHIELTLQRIASRRQSLGPLSTVATTLWDKEHALKHIFDCFFPQLISYTLSYQNQQPATPVATR